MRKTFFIALLPLILAASAAAQEAQDEAAPNALAPQTRFDGSVHLQSATKGVPRDVSVVARKWIIHGQQHVARFPEDGFLIVHLHSGKVTTVIDGKETAREPGDFWTVPQGASMSVAVTSESALLEIVKTQGK